MSRLVCLRIGDIVQTNIVPYVNFDAVFSAFSQCIVLSGALTFVARWCHNFREIAVKNCEKSKKSAEKFVRITSYR